jgi:hypothetical protein
MTHDEVKELIPAYALHALDSMDRLQLEEHLKDCPECRSVLREHQEAAGLLGFTAQPSIPSKSLRARLMEDVAADLDGAAKAKTSPVRSRRGVLILAAVAALIVVLVFLLPFGFRRGDGAITPEMKKILAAEGLTIQRLLPTREVPNASGQVFDPEETDEVLVFIKGLIDPKGGAYMIWLIVEGQAAPLGPVDVDSAGTAVIHIKKIPDDHEGFLVTREDSEDVRVPSGFVILRSIS